MEPRKPTLEDVARRAGVSRSTVSRVVNGQPSVAPPIRQKVQRVIRELDYRPHAAARALVSGRDDALDLVIIDEHVESLGANPYYSRVVAGTLTALLGSDVRMRVHVVDEPGAGDVVTEMAHAPGLGALLVNVPPELAVQFQRRCGRVVSLGRSAPQVPFIDAENAAGAEAAIRHLYDTGRRRVAAIYGPQNNPCAAGRRTGYLVAMHEAGLAPIATGGAFCRASGADATRRLLAQRPDIDAIFASCDLAATGALQVLAEHGRRVPDDVALVGFDDSILASCAAPAMTSVCQPVEEIAELAARALLEGSAGPRWERVLPAPLRIRQSTTLAA